MTDNNRTALEPQLRGYFIRNRVVNLLFRTLDAVLRAAGRFVRRQDLSRPVRRVLIANGAHLGDVVLSTSILPVIKAAYPEAQIGMLVGSWAGPVVQGHPLLDWVHHLDHWRLNRAALPLSSKIISWWSSRKRSLSEIREIDYDIAIDLYFYFPNSILLLWQAKIPHRIGYASAGFGPLLTKSMDIDMKSNSRSIIELHVNLIGLMPGVGAIHTHLAKPNIRRAAVDVKSIFGSGDYIILHVGTGDKHRDWPESSWKTLAIHLRSLGHRLVLTGVGAREKEIAERVCHELPNVINLCDRLTWFEFVEVVAAAKLLVSGNTVAPHVGAAVATPVVVVNHGINNLHLWHSPNANTTVLIHPEPCAPCYRNDGCASMACLRELAPSVVQTEVARILSLKSRDFL